MRVCMKNVCVCMKHVCVYKDRKKVCVCVMRASQSAGFDTRACGCACVRVRERVCIQVFFAGRKASDRLRPETDSIFRKSSV